VEKQGAGDDVALRHSIAKRSERPSRIQAVNAISSIGRSAQTRNSLVAVTQGRRGETLVGTSLAR
jgi:hypothetical protein